MTDVPAMLMNMSEGDELTLPREYAGPLEPLDQRGFFKFDVPDDNWFMVRSYGHDNFTIRRIAVGTDRIDLVIMWMLGNCPMDEVMELPRGTVPGLEPVEKSPYFVFFTTADRCAYMIEHYDEQFVLLRRIEMERLPDEP